MTLMNEIVIIIKSSKISFIGILNQIQSVLLYWELNLYCGFLIVKGGDPGPVVQEFLVLKVFL